MINKNAVWDAETLGIYRHKRKSDRSLTLFAIIAALVITTCFLVLLRDVAVLSNLMLNV